MILIYDDADAASVNTLVSPHMDGPGAPLNPSRTHTPPLIAPLSFAVIAVSIPSVLFSIITLPLSLISTLPTIIAFTISIPFYIGATYFYRNGPITSQNRSFVNPWRLGAVPKTTIILYTIFLQLLWIVAVINNSLVLVDSKRRLKIACFLQFAAEDWVNDACVYKALLFFLMSMILACIVVILLGAISWILLRWNPERSQPLGPSPPSLATQATLDDRVYDGTYLLIPLMHASFGLTIPPFAAAIGSFSNPNMLRFSISTTIASTLATHAHFHTLHRWVRIYKVQQTSSVKQSSLDPSITAILYLLLLLSLWVTATVMCAGYFLTDPLSGPTYLDYYQCDIVYDCPYKANIYLGVLPIATSIEVLLLGAMIAISVRYQIRKRRLRSPTSSVPMGQADKFSRTPVQPQHQPESGGAP